MPRYFCVSNKAPANFYILFQALSTLSLPPPAGPRYRSQTPPPGSRTLRAASTSSPAAAAAHNIVIGIFYTASASPHPDERGGRGSRRRSICRRSCRLQGPSSSRCRWRGGRSTRPFQHEKRFCPSPLSTAAGSSLSAPRCRRCRRRTSSSSPPNQSDLGSAVFGGKHAPPGKNRSSWTKGFTKQTHHLPFFLTHLFF
jgi:hypothetical protein